MSSNKLLLYLVCTISLLVASCSNEPQEQEAFLLKVNDFVLTEGDFSSMLKFELDADRNFDLSGDTRVTFLNDIIRKQLLIQEAQKAQLDREEGFRQTIQRYWEATLIRDLLTKKSEQFKSETAVTPEEIVAYFKDNKESFDGQELEAVQEDILAELEHERIGAMMEQWIEELVSNASVKVSDPELEKKLKEIDAHGY